ncbi:hypothetical protein LO772_11995 [Yinghuangia sp. ASG 101]|uniref:hypothetical protein n=1 Tax=Yinghuangia sp. ASG 101 TaxID=2896848 RepID=UPI001E52AD76|nr:hypothetical protein [Yinghuangia sp. ASG 101]UGQ14244.1 hypothetical protein LO772_11995 [Yinghuangia sp. ASG 101]
MDESAWSAEQTESVRLLRDTWRGSGIIFLGECRRKVPDTDEPSTAALSIGYASIPGAERVRSARELLALVGSGSSTLGSGFRPVEHAAGPCVVSLGASVLTLSAPSLPENVRKAVDGGVRCLEALAYIHPMFDDTCIAIALTTTSVREWPGYAEEFAGVVHSVRFGEETVE